MIKECIGIFLVMIFTFIGCTSISRDVYYAKLADENNFSYFFPSADFTLNFETIEKAYEYVRTANSKFSKNVNNKRRDKGLAAKLAGIFIGNEPVTLVCMIRASNDSDNIDLSKIDRPLDIVLKESEDALLFFIVFYDERIVSISNFYLDPKYGGYTDGNAQIKRFGINGNIYEAEYPVGWGIEKAFSYLRNEIK